MPNVIVNTKARRERLARAAETEAANLEEEARTLRAYALDLRGGVQPDAPKHTDEPHGDPWTQWLNGEDPHVQ